MQSRRILTTIIFIISTTTIILSYFYLSPLKPDQSYDQIRVVGFLAGLFVSVTTFTTIIESTIRHQLNPYGHPIKQFNSSLRQGTLVATGILFYFGLRMAHLYNPFTIISVILVLLFIEWYFRG